jgi:hypothetical protein
MLGLTEEFLPSVAVHDSLSLTEMGHGYNSNFTDHVHRHDLRVACENGRK